VESYRSAVLIIISGELVMNHHPRVLWMNTHHRPRILSFVVFPPAARALRRTPEDPA